MNKKLSAKLQKLIPTLGEKEAVIASSIAIEPLEKELILKKGSVYTVFDIENQDPLNVSLISKVINDVLFDAYYHSENVSPIQSLEKAIVNINEKLSTLATQAQQDEIQEQKPALNFNVVAGVLWGNVLYIVQYGRGKSFLMRDGEIKDVNATSEGNFSVASGVVKSEDVIVLCTENFAAKFPPEKLLDTALSPNELEPSQACMILKFVVDTEFTEDEVIDFDLPKETKNSKIASLVEKIKSKRPKKEPKVQPIATIADATESVPMQPRISPVQPKIKLRTKKKIDAKKMMAGIAILLVISIFATIVINANKSPIENEPATSEETALEAPKEPKPQTPPQEEQVETINSEEDLANKVYRVETQPFYDIKLADENAKPTGIAVFTNTAVVTDTTSGKIFTSTLETPKFTALETAFTGIKNAFNYNGKLSFVDNDGYKSFDLVDEKISVEHDGTFGTIGVYLDNIYSISDTTLTKYVPSGDTLNDSVWAELPDFENTVSMSIAYSIYTVTSEGDVNVYTQGNKSNYAVSGLSTPLKNPVKIIADTDFDYVYVADAGNNRIVVLDEDGEMIKQIKAQKDVEWNDIRDISITADEDTLFVLSGSRVFDVDLTDAFAPIEEVTTDETADTVETSNQ